MANESDRQYTGLVIPGGLVHAHIHLDKCFLLEKTPIGTGTFEEALKCTGKAKANFTKDDLFQRGSQLIDQSLRNGVLAMRAFVEVDPTVGLKCLEVGLELKKKYLEYCDIQLVIFAQDPLFYPDEDKKEKEMLNLMKQACKMTGQDTVIGSTPYVEKDYQAQCRNIEKMYDLAARHKRDVDFHLDYNLDFDQEPMIWFVLKEAQRRRWTGGITIGHATRLTLFNDEEWSKLADLCKGLKVSFIALPPSDLYMQGRQSPYPSRNRATLPLLELHKRDLCCALAVNNVGNLFTPQGNADPLALLPMMVALWQSATQDSLEALLSMVSSSAKQAIRADSKHDVDMKPYKATINVSKDGKVSFDRGQTTEDFTLLIDCNSVQEAVLSPLPARLAIKTSKLVAWTIVDSGIVNRSG